MKTLDNAIRMTKVILINTVIATVLCIIYTFISTNISYNKAVDAYNARTDIAIETPVQHKIIW